MGRWSVFALVAVLGACAPAWAQGTPSALVEQLRDPDHEVAAAACQALTKLGAEAVPDLIRGLRPAGTRQRLLILQALAGIGPAAADAVPAVGDCVVPGWDLASGASPSVPYASTYRIPPLPWEQAAGMLALSALGPRGRDALFSLPPYCTSEVQVRALASALSLCGSDAVPGILALLEPRSAGLRPLSPELAMPALEAIGPDAVAALRQNPRWQEWSRSNGPGVVRSVGPPVGVTQLREIIESVPWDAMQPWRQSTWELSRRSWSDEAIAELTRQAAEHPNPRVREMATQVLAWLPSARPEALSDLRRALQDDNMGVRRQAAFALGRVTRARAEAVAILREFVRTWPGDRHAAEWTRPGDREAAASVRAADCQAAGWALRALGAPEGRALLLNVHAAQYPAQLWVRLPEDWRRDVAHIAGSGAVAGIESLLAEFDREMEGVVPILVEWCTGGDAGLACVAATALVQVREPREVAVPAVLASLEMVDGTAERQRRLWPVSLALREMGAQVAPYALDRLAAVRCVSGYAMLEVLDSLERVPTDCVPALNALAGDPDCMVRANLLPILVRSADPHDLGRLIRPYLSDDTMVRAVGTALRQLPDGGAQVLVPWLESPDDSLRLHACRAASVYDYKVAPALVQAVRGLALEDPVEEIRRTATWAVWYEGDR
jgi:hypothetical protein